MEISPENINLGLNRYFAEVTATHIGTSESSFHAMRTNAMKQLLYDLEILTDISNHELVEEAKRTAEKGKAKKSKEVVANA